MTKPRTKAGEALSAYLLHCWKIGIDPDLDAVDRDIADIEAEASQPVLREALRAAYAKDAIETWYAIDAVLQEHGWRIALAHPTSLAHHANCALCHGRGWVHDGIDDGRMSGRADCPGPFVRPSQPVLREALDAERVPAFAKRLFAEIPLCTGCDLDHGWDDHVIAVFHASLDHPTSSPEDKK